jgi:hypothetical protein
VPKHICAIMITIAIPNNHPLIWSLNDYRPQSFRL